MCQAAEVWIQEFDFGLDHSFWYAIDFECGTEKLKSGASLQCWNSFFDCMFPSWSSSASIKRKCDAIFQIIFNHIHNGQRKTPFETAILQSIHDTCKSKNLIQIFNRLGLGISYDKVQQIDIGITQEIIRPNRVSVPKNITLRHRRKSRYNFGIVSKTWHGSNPRRN